MLSLLSKLGFVIVFTFGVYYSVVYMLLWLNPNEDTVVRVILLCILICAAMIRDWGPVKENDDFINE